MNRYPPYPAEKNNPVNQNVCYLIRYIYFLAGCLFINMALRAQSPVADFSASSVSGCVSFSVFFSDKSSGDPKFWNWDFGNGQLSNLQNPTATYPTPGLYTVTLVVRNADGTDGETKVNYINVTPSPTASFTANLTTACSPANIQFIDQSAPAGAITAYNWGFSDGTTSNLQNPTKLYTVSGYYGVILTVTTANGCQSSGGGSRYIRIINGIQADFDFTRTGVCALPIGANFINQTSGPGVLNYAWDFGDGQTSSAKDPSNSYSSLGTYPVKLTVRSNTFGCENTITKSINFGSTSTQIGAPATSCLNKPVNFTNASTPAPISSVWNFGDGTTSTQANPVKTYTIPGNYTVTLTSKYAECEGTATKDILITNQPSIDFTSANSTGCTVPYTVNFQSNVPGAISYSWNFGDGGTSTQANPAHTYNRTGSFNVTLSAVTVDGCPATITKSSFVNVNTNLSVSVNSVPNEGCIPLSFSPTANVNTPDGVASYLWTFGDGSTSTSAAPTKIYNTGGTYDVKLKITTLGGCTDSVTYPGAVKAGSPPVAAFDFTPITEGCAGVPVQFTDLSAMADKWEWSFGDGETSSLQNPIHLFADTGLLVVSLTASNNGCKATPVIKSMPRKIGPVAKFETFVDCSAPAATRLTVNFTNESLVDPAEAATTTYLWDFGFGGNTFAGPNPPPLTYPAAGKYNVSLTVASSSGSNCSYTLVKSIDLKVQNADFIIDDADICRNQPFQIKIKDIDTTQIKSFNWQIAGSVPFESTWFVDSSLSANGVYPVTLTIIDTFGCSSTKTIPDLINIVGTEADFNVVNGGGCADADITFTDLSTAPITQNWKFDYGNGQIISYNAPPFIQKYTDNGVYTVFLYVEDTYGCQDTAFKINGVTITKNIANFGAEKTLFCPGAALQFIDSSKGANLLYTWTFGDNTTANTANPLHVYTGGDATYSVKLYVTDAVGCADSLTRTNYISIVAPKPRFDAQDTVSLCPPLQTFFNSTSRDYDSLYWNFGDGNFSTLDTVANFYNEYGTYIAKLYTVGYGGCLDSASVTVKVLNPAVDARIFYDVTQKCDSLDVRFELTIPDNIKFYLYFNDGQIDSSGRKILNHVYRGAGLYTPTLLLRDALGCEVGGINGPGTIRINGALPLFNMDKKAFCDNGTVFFTDFTVGNDPVISRQWEFGDGATSPDDNTSHTYLQPGTYVVKNTVVTQSGCNSVFSDTVRVYRTPEINITGGDSVCIFNTLVLNAVTVIPDTATSWKWTSGSSTVTDSVVRITPTSVGQFRVNLAGANKLGCGDTTSLLVTVNPLPVITMQPSITTPVGYTVAMPVTYNDPALIYSWKPATYLDCTDCAVPNAVNPKFNTTYNVKVTDNNGCTATDTIQLITICNNINYFVPNTFSPNGDGNNDWFYPRGTSLNNIPSLRIFNRWGELVFEKRNMSPNSMTDGWNGTFKGKPAASDVYVYILEIVCDNAQVVPIKGNVTLVR